MAVEEGHLAEVLSLLALGDLSFSTMDRRPSLQHDHHFVAARALFHQHGARPRILHCRDLVDPNQVSFAQILEQRNLAQRSQPSLLVEPRSAKSRVDRVARQPGLRDSRIVLASEKFRWCEASEFLLVTENVGRFDRFGDGGAGEIDPRLSATCPT
jgi:hypothetical protein